MEQPKLLMSIYLIGKMVDYRPEGRIYTRWDRGSLLLLKRKAINEFGSYKKKGI